MRSIQLVNSQNAVDFLLFVINQVLHFLIALYHSLGLDVYNTLSYCFLEETLTLRRYIAFTVNNHDGNSFFYIIMNLNFGTCSWLIQNSC